MVFTVTLQGRSNKVSNMKIHRQFCSDCLQIMMTSSKWPQNISQSWSHGRKTPNPNLKFFYSTYKTSRVFRTGSQTRGPRAACGTRGPFVRPAMRFGNFQRINIYVAKCLEKRCREVIESKLNDIQCVFRPGRCTTDHISLSSKILRNLGSMLKMSSRALSTSRKHTTGFLPCDKLCGMLREYGVDGRLLLAVRSLCSCSDVCVRVGRVKLRPVTVSVGLRQGCALSPLLFIVYISGYQPICWRKPNPYLPFCWRASLKFFNTVQLARFVLQQNEVCYTKYLTFYWKTAEGCTKSAWEPNAALRIGV